MWHSTVANNMTLKKKLVTEKHMSCKTTMKQKGKSSNGTEDHQEYKAPYASGKLL